MGELKVHLILLLIRPFTETNILIGKVDILGFENLVFYFIQSLYTFFGALSERLRVSGTHANWPILLSLMGNRHFVFFSGGMVSPYV